MWSNGQSRDPKKILSKIPDRVPRENARKKKAHPTDVVEWAIERNSEKRSFVLDARLDQ